MDLIMVMLGTNDLKRRFDLRASDIAQSAAAVAATGISIRVRQWLAPPGSASRTTGRIDLDRVRPDVCRGTQKSRQFSRYFRLAAGWRRLPFFDAGSVIVSSEKDGIHFDADEHRKLGEALADEVHRLSHRYSRRRHRISARDHASAR